MFVTTTIHTDKMVAERVQMANLFITQIQQTVFKN